jgi:hypothetical protein
LAKALFAIDGTFMPLPLLPFAFIFISICTFALVVLQSTNFIFSQLLLSVLLLTCASS